MGSFAKYVGGSPTNTAVGAARLGLKTAVITRVGADHFGRFIREELAREGVDVRAVAPTRSGSPRSPSSASATASSSRCSSTAPTAPTWRRLERHRSALHRLGPGHADQRHPPLHPHLFEASLKAARAAKGAGRAVVFDIDYRPVLWGLTAPDRGEDRFVADQSVTQRLRDAAGFCDLIVGTEEEFQILGGEADTEAALRAVRQITGALLVCKRGPMGCVLFAGPVDKGYGQHGALRGRVDDQVAGGAFSGECAAGCGGLYQAAGGEIINGE